MDTIKLLKQNFKVVLINGKLATREDKELLISKISNGSEKVTLCKKCNDGTYHVNTGLIKTK